MASPAARIRRWLAAALLIAVAACEPTDVPTAPPSGTTSSTTTPSATSVPPSGGDDTAALAAAIVSNPVTVIDRPMRIDNILKITTSNRTVTFTGSGALVRNSVVNPANPSDTRGFPGVWVQGASNVTLNNLTLAGPGGVCDVPRTDGTTGPPYAQIFDKNFYAQHAISIDGTTNLVINGGYVHDMRGDGVYLSGQAKGTRVNDLHTRCTGRSSISNVDSTDTVVTGGFYERSGLWAFNVEPDAQTTRHVDGYLIDRPKVGITNWELLWVGGNCRVTGVVLNKPDLTLRNGANTTRGCGTPTGVPSFVFNP